MFKLEGELEFQSYHFYRKNKKLKLIEVKNDLPRARQFVSEMGWNPIPFPFHYIKHMMVMCGLTELNQLFEVVRGREGGKEKGGKEEGKMTIFKQK
jgi:hypothetical protein